VNPLQYDLLLTYLSEKGAGTLAELKDAWSWICGSSKDDPAAKGWIAARDLAALGHIEVAWEQQSWCAAPPLLTMIPRSGGRVFVTGARTGFFERALERAAEEHELWVDECGGQQGPTSIFVACQSHLDAEALAAELGVAYTYQVADQIASLLSPLESYERLFQEKDLPRGLESEYFHPDTVEWAETTEFDDPGLYRCRTHQGHVHALLGPTGHWNRVIREIGVYEVLRWEQRDVLEYSVEQETLSVPTDAALPPLHARAATLCSGRLPAWERSNRRWVLRYVNVPAQIAEQIAFSLRQRLQEVAA
jgi:hypothetical protein